MRIRRKVLVSRVGLFLSGWLGLLLGGCTATYAPPDLGGLYNRAAQLDGTQRNPVIVIPGILGSKLYDPKSGELVWGAFSGGAMSPDNPEGARTIALPMEPGKRLGELTDDVIADGALDQVTVDVFGLSLELNAYFQILNTLGAGGYRDRQLAVKGGIDYGEEHFTCFQFDYDWRRDIVGSARQLHEFILARRAYVQEEIASRYGIADHDVKFDLVAHSMGGLGARYYLRYGPADLPEDGSLPPLTWEGARYVDCTFATRLREAGVSKSGSIRVSQRDLHRSGEQRKSLSGHGSAGSLGVTTPTQTADEVTHVRYQGYRKVAEAPQYSEDCRCAVPPRRCTDAGG